MTREELERAVYDIASADMEIALFNTGAEILEAIQGATDKQLADYLEEVNTSEE